MPILYTPEQLSEEQVPTVSAIRSAPLLIKDALRSMLHAGEILGATSYGSVFQQEAPVTCASDIDWLIIFKDTPTMFHSQRWRTLLLELERENIHFYVPAISLEHIRTGNHTICSLLHGIRQAQKRIITGEDPLHIMERCGASQNAVPQTLQLFASFTRFFFEAYAQVFKLHNTSDEHIRVLNDAISVWKDVMACMIVRCIPPDQTLPVRWSVYQQLYKDLLPQEVMFAGRRMANFLENVRARMDTYDRLRHTGGDLDAYDQKHEQFLEESVDIVPAVATFAEANIALYRAWATQASRKASQPASFAYNRE